VYDKTYHVVKQTYLQEITMNTLSCANVLDALARHTANLAFHQIMTPDHPDAGALVNHDYDLPDNKLTSAFMTACAYLNLFPPTADESLLQRADLAADYLLKAQRPTGNIDLLSVNYDSSPDTGFTVQQLCTVVELARCAQANTVVWQSLLGKIEIFIRRAIPGILNGGFHTPNHRWVMTSALVQAKSLYPDLEVAEVVNAYLAEGFDIDEEGLFLERSIGVYDAVNTRSLLLIAANWPCPQALDAVTRNLEFNLYMLHDDGTAETGLSRRQDYGVRTVPLGIAHAYLLRHAVQPNPRFVAAAQKLWQCSQQAGEWQLWLAYPLLKHGDPTPSDAPLPENFSSFFPRNGIWRVRRNRLSASLFGGVTQLLTLIHGAAELTSMKISATYFGGLCGRFSADEFTVADNTAALLWTGLNRPRRPGYELPLGRAVPPEQWDARLPERDLRRVPPLRTLLTVQEVHEGFDLRVQTLDGLDGVAFQIAFDFAPGGVWESGDTRLAPQSGQVIFLKQGWGEMRYGSDAIRMGPGAYGHGMFAMREAEPAPGHVRILVAFRTPVDSRLCIRAYRGLPRSV
jgi:hypothetical protein